MRVYLPLAIGPAARLGPEASWIGTGAIAVTVLCLLHTSPLMAQTNAPPFLEEIIVTAQKREQSLQDVPIAVSAVTAVDIENRSIVNFTELFSLMPNTIVDQGVSAIPSISIRGVNSNVNNLGIESGVGVAVDEIFLGRPSAFSTQLIDVERVEVLRGPQGTLFGKNTIGGLVNVVTRKPQNKFAASADVTVGEHDLRQVRGYLTGPILDNRLAAKISFTTKQRDGWVENRNPDLDDLESEDFWGLRGQLLGTPSDSFSWLLTTEYSEDDSVENFEDIIGGALAPLDGDAFDRSISTNGPDFFRREIYGASLKLEWEVGMVDVTSISAVRGVDWSGSNDGDYSELPLFVGGRDENQDQISQEVRVAGGSGDVTWLAGAYYFHQEQDGTNVFALGEATPPFFGAPFTPGYEESASTYVEIESESVAAFFSGTYSFAERWELTGGARFTREKKDMRYEQVLDLFEIAPGVPMGVIMAFNLPVAPFNDSLSDNGWSGDLSIAYQLSDDVNSYFKISRGFKAGGFDTGPSAVANPGNLQFEPEFVTSYEAGLKSDLSNDRVRINVAAFYMDFEDKQEQFFNGVTSVTSNAASAEVSGVEFELTSVPLSGLLLGTTIGYQDGAYDQYRDPLTSTDFSGNRLPKTPEWTGSVTAQLDHELPNGWALLLRADGIYRGESHTNPGNDPRFSQESSIVVDARLALSSPSDSFSVALWSRNLLDEDYRTGGFEVIGLAEYQRLNAPRTWGLELTGRFGDQ